jgi:hypothetical protein
MSEEQTVGGVDIVLARMDTHPEEFYGEEKKWAFIYKEYFRDVMTEIERGQLFEKLKKIRRQEFNERVFTTLVPPEEVEDEEVAYTTPPPRPIRLTSPDGSISKMVAYGSQSFKDLISQGWIDPKRMRTSS